MCSSALVWSSSTATRCTSSMCGSAVSIPIRATSASPATRISRSSSASASSALPPPLPPQKRQHHFHEAVEPVVVHPVPGTLDRRDFGALEVLDAPVGDRVSGPAFIAADEQSRAGDLGPELVHL